MKTRVEQPPESLNPVFSISKDGTILYSNEASEPILNEWGVRVGDKLPLSIIDLVQRVISRNSPEKIEVKAGNKVYLVVLSPLSEQELVNISGFDISGRGELGEKAQESEERLKALLDHNPSLVFMKDECGRYVYLNKSYEEQFVHSKDWYGKTDFDFWPKESAELFQANDSLVLKSGHIHQFMEDSTNLKGTRYCWLNYKFPFTDSKNKKYVGGVGIDVTDRVRAEEALQESEERYRMLFTNMTEGFVLGEVIFNENGKPSDYRYLEVNPAFELQARVKKEKLLGKSISEIFPNPDPVQFKKLEEVILSGQSTRLDYFSQKLGKYFEIYIFNPEKGKIAAIFRDITERKRAEEALHESELKYRALSSTLEERVKERTFELEQAYKSLKESETSLDEAQELAHIGNWIRDFATGEVHWSDEVYRIFGFKPQEFGINYESFMSRVHPEDRNYVTSKVKKSLSDRFFDVEYRIVRVDNEERVVYENVKVIYDKENIPVQIKGTVQDITERKKAEEALAKTEILRKQEIHHRIKNNLQVISSLLDLQTEKFRGKKNIGDSQILKAFQESQNRIISMALIHEELHKGGKVDTLNISHYIEELVNNLLLTYSVFNNIICLDMDIEKDIFFDMDTSVPLGIIINELVSNSLKYAFPGGDNGEIQIKLHRKENVECESEDCNPAYVLMISDNGIGIPKNLDIEDIDSLGLQLVTSLVDQLDGKFDLKRNNGTKFIIRFTVKER